MLWLRSVQCTFHFSAVVLATTDNDRQYKTNWLTQLSSWKHDWWTDRSYVVFYVRRGMNASSRIEWHGYSSVNFVAGNYIVGSILTELSIHKFFSPLSKNSIHNKLIMERNTASSNNKDQHSTHQKIHLIDIKQISQMNLVVSRGRWSSLSPKLSTSVFFFWGYLCGRFYASNSRPMKHMW